MSVRHAEPGEVISLRPEHDLSRDVKSVTLAKNGPLQIIRLAMEAGKEIPKHQAPGYLIAQCLEGQIEFTAKGATQRLEPGKLVYLAPHEPHAVRCIERGALLLTLVSARGGSEDEVQEASEESFPASDSPGWTGASA